MGYGAQKKRILIADDSEMNRSILAEMLGEDYEIIEAENGVQAVEIMRERRGEIAVLLLDMIMPEMNGLQVLSVMNENHWMEDLPVIMISTESDPARVREAYENGVTEYIMRPFDAIVVRRRVVNTILVSANRKRLMEMVSEEVGKNESRKNDMERLYKCVMMAQRHSSAALRMIENGQCGEVPSEFVECLHRVTDTLQDALRQDDGTGSV